MTVLDQPALIGSTTPRLWTEPQRDLTPETSYGFAVVEFARDVLSEPLDPWQEWLVIHAGELLEDGRPRFRQVLVIVSRQQGKTHLLATLALFWQFVERWPLILGMSTNRDVAREAWDKSVTRAQDIPKLAAQLPKNGVLRGNNDVHMKTVHRSKYKITTSDRRGGRGLTVDRLIIDELREHDSWDAWNAAVPAMSARPHAQMFAITNQGDDKATVLEATRKDALDGVNPRLAIFEWSGPEGCDVDDPEAIAAANPNVGRRTHWDDLLGPARQARAAGGEREAGFRTEYLCQRVRMLDPAIDPQRWHDCLEVGQLADARSRLALCVDLSRDERHATLAAAAVLDDGRVRVETIAEWTGPTAATDLERDLPGWVEKVGPKAVGWFPTGPAAAIAAKLADRRKDGVRGWPPRGVTVTEIRGEASAVCMGLNKEVAAGTLAHSGQGMLDAQVAGAEWTRRGDARVFTRRLAGHVDAVYAVAGALYLARTLPTRREVSRKVHAGPM